VTACAGSAASFVDILRHLFIYKRLKLRLFTPGDRLGQGRPPYFFTCDVMMSLTPPPCLFTSRVFDVRGSVVGVLKYMAIYLLGWHLVFKERSSSQNGYLGVVDSEGGMRGCLTLENVTDTLPRNVGNPVPICAA